MTSRKPHRRMMRSLAASLLAAALSLAVAGYAPAEAATSARRIKGTTTVTLNEWDYCGPGGAHEVVNSYTGTLSSTLDLTTRKSAGGLTESNPFHFHYLAGSVTGFGALELDSAQAPNGVLQQYWKFTRVNGKVSGTMNDNGASTATDWNLLNGQKQLIPCQNQGSFPFTYGVRTGAKMSGTITSTSARVTFSGWTLGGEYSFKYKFVSA